MRTPSLQERDLTRVTQSVRELIAGGTNAIGLEPLTLEPGATTTVVNAPLCTNNSHVTLTPLTESAALATWWISAVGNGMFTIGHDNAPDLDRNFSYEIRRT